ncbi:hypothetical protein ACLB2K_019511 [Fragaria x ananassa]
MTVKGEPTEPCHWKHGELLGSPDSVSPSVRGGLHSSPGNVSHVRSELLNSRNSLCVVDCTLKIRTVRENGEWRIDNEVWRTLPPLDADVGVACNAFIFYPKSVEPCLQLEGALHWLSEAMGAIIVFDLETEEFRDIRLPMQGIHHNIVDRLFRFEGRLALMRVSVDIMVVNIWSLDYATEQCIRQPIDRRIIFDDLYMGLDWASEPLSNYFHDFVMMKEFVISVDDIWINASITATRVFR